MSLLTEGLNQLKIDYSDQQLKQLTQYISEIEMWNPRYGLVNASGDDLVVRHILDSLSGVPVLSDRNISTLADVGSGAGLPGIPLAIMLPHVQVSLIERSGKRVRFLRNIQAVLNLKNLTVLEQDLKDVKEHFDLVTFRAFKPIEPGILDLLLNILQKEGYLAAFKGKMKNIKSETKLVGNLAKVQDLITLDVPGLKEERHLVLYSKKG